MRRGRPAWPKWVVTFAFGGAVAVAVIGPVAFVLVALVADPVSTATFDQLGWVPLLLVPGVAGGAFAGLMCAAVTTTTDRPDEPRSRARTGWVAAGTTGFIALPAVVLLVLFADEDGTGTVLGALVILVVVEGWIVLCAWLLATFVHDWIHGPSQQTRARALVLASASCACMVVVAGAAALGERWAADPDQVSSCPPLGHVDRSTLVEAAAALVAELGGEIGDASCRSIGVVVDPGTSNRQVTAAVAAAGLEPAGAADAGRVGSWWNRGDVVAVRSDGGLVELQIRPPSD